MPDSRIIKIHKKLQELIDVDFAAGYSGTDMQDRIIRGSVVQPPFVPYGCVFFVDARENFGPTLGRYQGTARFDIYAFIGGTDEPTRHDNAANLASDMIEALTNNRQLGLANGVIDDVLCSFTAIDGDTHGLDQIGIGYIQVEIKFQTSTGA